MRHQVVNDLPLGRDIDEMLRMVDALQFTEEHGEVCPAGWKKGKKGMKASTEGVAKYLAENAAALYKSSAQALAGDTVPTRRDGGMTSRSPLNRSGFFISP